MTKVNLQEQYIDANGKPTLEGYKLWADMQASIDLSSGWGSFITIDGGASDTSFLSSLDGGDSSTVFTCIIYGGDST